MAKKVKKVDDAEVKVKVSNLFDHLNAITQKKPKNYWEGLSDGDRKSWSNYMVLRYLSMNTDYLEMISELQPYIQELEPGVLSKLLIDALPYDKSFLKYISGEKSEKYESWLVDVFTTHYQTSKKEVVDYLKILYITEEGKFHIKHICESYGVEPDKIKKLKLG
jgi:hypothetical protein